MTDRAGSQKMFTENDLALPFRRLPADLHLDESELFDPGHQPVPGGRDADWRTIPTEWETMETVRATAMAPGSGHHGSANLPGVCEPANSTGSKES